MVRRWALITGILFLYFAGVAYGFGLFSIGTGSSGATTSSGGGGGSESISLSSNAGSTQAYGSDVTVEMADVSVTSGDFIVVAYATNSSGNALSQVTDTASNSYTIVTTGGTQEYLSYAYATANATSTVDITAEGTAGSMHRQIHVTVWTPGSGETASKDTEAFDYMSDWSSPYEPTTGSITTTGTDVAVLQYFKTTNAAAMSNSEIPDGTAATDWSFNENNFTGGYRLTEMSNESGSISASGGGNFDTMIIAVKSE